MQLGQERYHLSHQIIYVKIFFWWLFWQALRVTVLDISSIIANRKNRCPVRLATLVWWILFTSFSKFSVQSLYCIRPKFDVPQYSVLALLLPPDTLPANVRQRSKGEPGSKLRPSMIRRLLAKLAQKDPERKLACSLSIKLSKYSLIILIVARQLDQELEH